MEKVLLLVGKELELARLQDKITQQVQDQVDDQQREFFLVYKSLTQFHRQPFSVFVQFQ